MIKITSLDIGQPNDSETYQKLMNNPDIKILLERHTSDKDGNSYCLIKYDEPEISSKMVSLKQSAPHRI